MTQHAKPYKDRVMAAEPGTKRETVDRRTVLTLSCGHVISELQGHRAWMKAWAHIKFGRGVTDCAQHPSAGASRSAGQDG